MKIQLTRAMIRAALNGRLAQVPTEADPVFGLNIPASCPDVPADVLHPSATWCDQTAYETQARRLAHMMASAFEPFAAQASPAVRAAGPQMN
jgi:phosphoenolpyruvate carboxykinase (ATP)